MESRHAYKEVERGLIGGYVYKCSQIKLKIEKYIIK
jgi:hypothetical protein